MKLLLVCWFHQQPFYHFTHYHNFIVTITESPVIVHQRTRNTATAKWVVAVGCDGLEKYEYQEQDPLMLSAAMEAPELHCVLHDNVILTALSLEYQPSTEYLQIGCLSLT